MASSFTRLCAFSASLSLALILTHVPLASSSNPEVDALIALKSSLSDPDNVLASWFPGAVLPVVFEHISFNYVGEVTQIDLSQKRLSGHLVPDLAKLGRLEHLFFNENKINGSIPAEFGNLDRLQSLEFYDNNLSGTIPPSLGKLTSLTSLRLGKNRLTGTIPKELANLSSLKHLDLSNNDLCGPIPPGLGRNSTVKLENNPRLGKPCP